MDIVLSTALEELIVHEDPVTGVWSFQLQGRHVEVERKHGFVKIDGALHEASLFKSLEKVQQLGGKPLRHIRDLIAATESQESLRQKGSPDHPA